MKKLYKCPECNTLDNELNWNAQTSLKFRSTNIVKISNKDSAPTAYFYCPNCERLINSLDILVSESTEQKETVTISKAEYEELLEIKSMYENLG